MLLVPAIFAVGCAAALGLAAYSRDPARLWLSLDLAVACAVANALWFWNALDYLPLIDLAVGVHAVAFALKRTEKWLHLFIQLIALRLTLHVVVYLIGQAVFVLYAHGLNATFALLLMAVSHAGGLHARNHLLGHLSGIGAGLRAALRAPPSRLNG